MTKQQLIVLLERAETWSQEAQEELVRTAIEIERKHAGIYHLDEEERADIARALRKSSAARSRPTMKSARRSMIFAVHEGQMEQACPFATPCGPRLHQRRESTGSQ